MKCTKHDEKMADKLFDKAIQLEQKSKFDEAATIYHHLLDCHTDSIEEWNLCLFLGIYYRYSDCSKSLDYLLRSLELYPPLEKEEIMYLMLNHYLGMVYYLLDKYEEALASFDEVFNLLNLYNNEEWMSEIYIHHLFKGRTYMFLRKEDKAIIEFQCAWEANEATNDKKEIKIARSGLNFEFGRAWFYNGSFDKANEYLEKVDIAYLDEYPKQNYYYTYFRNNVHASNNDKALEIYKQLEGVGIHSDLEYSINHLLGRLYFNLGMFEKSGTHFKKVSNVPKKDIWILDDVEKYKEKLRNIN